MRPLSSIGGVSVLPSSDLDLIHHATPHSASHLCHGDGPLSSCTPLDAAEVNGLLKFGFYCGYELLCTHPVMRAISMLGRASCGLISIKDACNASIKSFKGPESNRLELGGKSSDNTGIDAYDSPSSDGYSIDSEASVEGVESVDNFGSRESEVRCLTASEISKALTVTGESCAAVGYVAGALNANMLYVVMVDGGFSFITVNCFLLARASHEKCKQLERCEEILARKDYRQEVKDSLISEFQQQNRERSIASFCQAGYGTAFTISFGAPYVGLAIFSALVGVDYAARLVSKSANGYQAEFVDGGDLSELNEGLLVTLLEYFHKEKAALKRSLDDQGVERPRAVIHSLLAHEENRSWLQKSLSNPLKERLMDVMNVCPVEGAQAEDQSLMAVASMLGKKTLVPSTFDCAGVDSVSNRSIDYKSSQCIKLVEQFVHGIDSSAKSLDKQADSLAGDEGDQVSMRDALFFMGLSFGNKDLEIAQLYDRAYDALKLVLNDRATSYKLLANEMKSRLLQEK